MADEESTPDEKAPETRVARTAGISGIFHVGDLTITPEGTEITQDQWENVVAPAATENHVIVRLDEDFIPRALQEQQAETKDAAADSATKPAEAPDFGDGTEPTAGVNQGTSVDTAPPAPGTGTASRGRKGS